MKSCDEVTIDYETARKELLEASKSHNRGGWTMEKKLLIAEFYGIVSPEKLSKLIGKNKGAIGCKAQHMGIVYTATKEERAVFMKKIRNGEIV